IAADVIHVGVSPVVHDSELTDDSQQKTNAVEIVKIVQAEAVSETTAALNLVGLTGVVGDIDGYGGVHNRTEDLDFEKTDEEIVRVDASDVQAVPIDRSMLDASDQVPEISMSNVSTVELAAVPHMPTLAFSASMENLILEASDQIDAEDMITENAGASMVPTINNEFTFEVIADKSPAEEVNVVVETTETRILKRIVQDVEHAMVVEELVTETKDAVTVTDNCSRENSLIDSNSHTTQSESSDITIADGNSGSPTIVASNAVKSASKQRLKKIKSKLRREQEEQNSPAAENVPSFEVHVPNSVGHEPNGDLPTEQPTSSVVLERSDNGNPTVNEQSSTGAEKQHAKSTDMDKQDSTLGFDNIAQVTEAPVAANEKTAPANMTEFTDDVRDIVDTDRPDLNHNEDAALERRGAADTVRVDFRKVLEFVETPVELLTKNQRNKMRSKKRRAEEAKATDALENSNLDALQHSASADEINGPVNANSAQNATLNAYHTKTQKKLQKKLQKRLAMTKTKSNTLPMALQDIQHLDAPNDGAQTAVTNTEETTTNPITLREKKPTATPKKVLTPTATTKKSSKSTLRTNKFGDITILHLPDRDAENQAIISTFDNAELTEDGDILVHVRGAPSYIITTQSERKFRLSLAASNARVAEIDRRIAEEDAVAAIANETVGGKGQVVSEDVDDEGVSEVKVKDSTKEECEGVDTVGDSDSENTNDTAGKVNLDKKGDISTVVLPPLPMKIISTPPSTKVITVEKLTDEKIVEEDAIVIAAVGNGRFKGEVVSEEINGGDVPEVAVDETKKEHCEGVDTVSDSDSVNTSNTAAEVDSDKDGDVSAVVLPPLPAKITSTPPSKKVIIDEKLMVEEIKAKATSAAGEETDGVGKVAKPAISSTLMSLPETPVTEVLLNPQPSIPGTAIIVTQPEKRERKNQTQPKNVIHAGVNIATASNLDTPQAIQESVVTDSNIERSPKWDNKLVRFNVIIIDSLKAVDLVLLSRLSESGPDGHVHNYSLFRDDRQPGLVFKVVE
ncbi:hypothetical protein HDU76_005420, partial [Blyttiomyces sp. JEL0837]